MSTSPPPSLFKTWENNITMRRTTMCFLFIMVISTIFLKEYISEIGNIKSSVSSINGENHFTSNIDAIDNLYDYSSESCARSILTNGCDYDLLNTCTGAISYAERHDLYMRSGNFIVLEAFDSIGNFMGAVQLYIRLARLLELALIINTTTFPSIETVVAPNLFDYRSEGLNELDSSKFHIFKISGGYLQILKENVGKLETLKQYMPSFSSEIPVHPSSLFSVIEKSIQLEPVSTSCLYRVTFKRTPYTTALTQKINMVLPENFRVWHIRTPHGEQKGGYNLTVHTYILNQEPEKICDAFKRAHFDFKTKYAKSVYISANSLSLRYACANITELDITFLKDLTLGEHEYHTAGKLLPSATIVAFMDIFYMLRASTLIYSGSSFASIVVDLKEMTCENVNINDLLLIRCVTYQSGGSMPKATPEQNNLKSVSALSTFPLALENSCQEPLWCNASISIQKEVDAWQNPSPKKCQGSKFLVYEPLNYGIGSMIHIAATGLSLAICTGRILYYPKQASVNNIWRSKGCDSTSLDCYFEDITSCRLDEKDFATLPTLNVSNWQHLQNTKIVRIAISDLPSGPCTFCQIPEEFPFLPNSQLKGALLGSEAPLMAPLVRYILRPRKWFSDEVQKFINSQKILLKKPFASIHVRYGDKYLEAPPMPLETYMSSIVSAKHIRNIFVSTETEMVLKKLPEMYPHHRFFNFSYNRIETTNPGQLQTTQRQSEFVAAFANLYISIQADLFVGSLTSNWCRLIHELERTRGDSGHDYHGVDGSQHSRCFSR